MRGTRFCLMLIAVAFCAGATRAARLDGSVFLMPIDTEFSSVGSAQYVNDLNQRASAALSGTHSVDGPISFQTPVTGDGSYFYILQGPADAGDCYSTSLHVSADPPGLFNSMENDWFGSPRCAPRVVEPPPGGYGSQEGNGSDSPIVINFEKGGYLLTGSDSPVVFDIEATGQPVRLGWTAGGANEAFLCLDRNQDGKVDSGAELFGDATSLKSGQRAPHGFVALAEFDDNHDGVIDAVDAIWPQLLLWRDLNHDGISQSGEIVPVASSTLKAISLEYHWTGRRDSSGNTFRYESKVWISDNGHQTTARPVYDIFFVPVP